MKILLQGQLGALVSPAEITQSPPAGSTIADLIIQLCETLPDEARQLILKEDGSLRQSLFVAIDDNHVRDLDATIPEGSKELILMPPMAGG